jgi:hypothetical protein
MLLQQAFCKTCDLTCIGLHAPMRVMSMLASQQHIRSCLHCWCCAAACYDADVAHQHHSSPGQPFGNHCSSDQPTLYHEAAPAEQLG